MRKVPSTGVTWRVGMDLVHFSMLEKKHWFPSAKSASILVSWRFFLCLWRLPRSGLHTERDVWHLYKCESQERNQLEMLKCWCENLALAGERTGILCPARTTTYCNIAMQWFGGHLEKDFFKKYFYPLALGNIEISPISPCWISCEGN